MIILEIIYIGNKHLQPSNIIFVGYNQVKVCDLGIVTDIGITNGNAGDERTFGQGTAMYMAPEQVQSAN